MLTPVPPAPGLVPPSAADRRAAADRVLAPIYARGDHYIGVLVTLHAVLAALLAPVYGTWRVSAGVTAAAVGAFFAARAYRPGSLLTRCVAGLALQSFCALHIHQMNGLAEMHFFYFTSATAMILYQDWRALWPGVLGIIAQHTLFAAGHNAGWHPGGQTFFEVSHVGPLKLTFHFGIVLAQTAIASVASRTMRARTLADAAQQRRLEQANTVLELQSAELEAANLQLQDQATELELQAATLEERRVDAERANRAKGEFLATMSHELRTPLNAISGYVQLLEMELHGPVTPAQRGALARVQRSQRHLLGLINDVLNFAKLKAGRVEYRVEPVALADVVADLAPMIEPQLAARHLAFATSVPADAVALADREKLGQVLLNLLSNAVKFTPVGGRIAVDAGPAPDEGRCELRVRDTGVGIPADRLDCIFEPFVQVDQRLSRSHEGTGLGLAISRELARGMGGDLTAASVPGEGSVFTVALSVASARAMLNAAAAPVFPDRADNAPRVPLGAGA